MKKLLVSSCSLLFAGLLCVVGAGQGGTAGQAGTAGNGSASADSATAAATSVPRPAAKAKKNIPLAITPEREAAAITFVERNHGELAGLLGSLKANQPKQYEQAIREIYRVTERLASVQERDPLLYELEVKLWTAQSQVQLLAARLKMSDSEEYRQQLREALSAQIAARLEVLKHQRTQAKERLAKMDREIQLVEENREQAIEKQLDVLTRLNAKTNPKAVSKTVGKAPVKRPGKVSERKAAE
jgi:hypothetical protein